MVSVTFTLTRDEVVRTARRLLVRHMWSWRKSVIWVAVIGLVLVVNPFDYAVADVVSVLAFLLISEGSSLVYRPRQTWTGNSWLRREQTVTFGENGVVHQTAGAESRSSWGCWSKVQEVPLVHILWDADGHWLLVPKRALDSPATEAFLDLTGRHISAPDPATPVRRVRVQLWDVAAVVLLAAVGGLFIWQLASTAPTKTPAAETFALAQWLEHDFLLSGSSSGPFHVPHHRGTRLYTGCAQQSARRWLCVAGYASSPETVTSARERGRTEVTADANAAFHFRSISNPGTLAISGGTVPGKYLQNVRGWDGTPPNGHQQGHLTFYYATGQTVKRVGGWGRQ